MKSKIDNFLDKLDRSPNTIRTYRWALEYFAGTVGTDAALDMGTYEKFLGTVKHLSPSTKRVLVTSITALYDFYNLGEPMKMAKINKVYTRKAKSNPVVFDKDAVETILNYCSNLTDGMIELRDRAFVLTLADSGFRISELAGLKRGDVDWNESRVVIRGKGDKVAVIRLSERASQAIQEYLGARGKMDGGSNKELASLPLFCQHRSTRRVIPITSDGMRQSLKLRMEEAGANARVHDFRHYFVTTVMLASGGNLKLAQELARHESTTTTQRYAHLTNTELDEKYDEIFNRSE